VHSFYQHVKRPEWGVSTIVDTLDDRTVYLFDDGTRRTIGIGHLHLMQSVELSQEAAAEIQRKLDKHLRVRSGTTATKRKRVTKKKPKGTAASSPPPEEA
jgi:hypothetical protein